VTTLREILLDARDQIIDARGLADWQFQREVLADLAAGARIALEAALEPHIVQPRFTCVCNPCERLRALLSELDPEDTQGGRDG
jgi:hypothetical protein